MQTADRRRTTAQRAAPGTGSGPAKVYEGRPEARRTGDHVRERRARRYHRSVRRTIAGIGRMLVTLGLLILLFVAYQLWGTGIFTARAQADLKKRLRTAARSSPARRRTRSVRLADDRRRTAPRRSTTTTTSPRVDPRRRSPHRKATPRAGSTIPKIGVDMDLRRGHVARRPEEGPGPLSGHAVPGHDRQRRDRRPPHDVPAPVLRPRRAGARRRRSSSRRSSGTFTYTDVAASSIVKPTDVCGRRQHARRRS